MKLKLRTVFLAHTTCIRCRGTGMLNVPPYPQETCNKCHGSAATPYPSSYPSKRLI